ncbi:peptidoglycan editing factor PgeF [Corynebacterium argentoratense]|uniref:peptidoglycan editing factor PgeF n=1 Tax=Corynebacterium argentoratense TaxID=42817 RepID=UPI00248D501A|nr:peptidoglycan editing factor PgeF [Corynebacterium argentoratense]
MDRPVRKVFTSRRGGVSAVPYDSFNLGDNVGDDPQAVAANRARLAEVLGLQRLVWMEQMHTNTVTVVDSSTDNPVAATDAIVTTERGLGLCVLVADCTPVLLSDHDAGVVAAVHAGRLGARNGIVARTVDTMVGLGANPEKIHALLGPAVSGERYELPEAMARDVDNHLPGSYCTTLKGTPGVDIRAGLAYQLYTKGVSNIDINPRCTIEDPEFFSHRREGVTGRQAGVIWLTEQ